MSTDTDRKFSRYEMYTDEANGAVGFMVATLIRAWRKSATEFGVIPTRKVIIDSLNENLKDVAAIFAEVHDTEPEWAIVDEVNRFLDEIGITHIDRDDLS